MKINYHIISESFDQNLQSDYHSLIVQLQDFLYLLKMMSDNETVLYSADLYNKVITDGEPLAEWLYSGGELRDEKRIFQLMFRKMEEVEKNIIKECIDQLKNLNYQNPSALLTFNLWDSENIEKTLIVQNYIDCLNTRRFYLNFIDDHLLFLEECKNSFPNLVINNRVQQTIKKYKPFREYRSEIIIHLSVLSDHGKQLFEKYKHQNETVVLRHLSIIGDIDCSAQGDPEYEKKNLCFAFPSDKGDSIEIICAPHTKLFNKHSSERIYFNWGHSEVEKGVKLLIGHIGDHL